MQRIKQTKHKSVISKYSRLKSNEKEVKETTNLITESTITKVLLEGNVNVGRKVDIIATDSVMIGTLSNVGSSTLPVNIETNKIDITSMNYRNESLTGQNTFSFLLGPGTSAYGTKDKPIEFTSTNNNTDIQCIWGTKKVPDYDSLNDSDLDSDRGYYVHIYGQYFDGNTPDSIEDDDSFCFWKDNNEGDPETTNQLPYTTNTLTKRDAQWYFKCTQGILIRTDIIKEIVDDVERTRYIDIMMIPGDIEQDPESFNYHNTIIAKYQYTDEDIMTVDYKKEIYYPFRKNDEYTKKIYYGNRFGVDSEGHDLSQLVKNNFDWYCNDLIFINMRISNDTDTNGQFIFHDYIRPEERIVFDLTKLGTNENYKVHFKDLTFLHYSIKDYTNPNGTNATVQTSKAKEIRYNDTGYYFKQDITHPDISNFIYKEQPCDTWIIDRDISYNGIDDNENRKYKNKDSIRYSTNPYGQRMYNALQNTTNDDGGKVYTFKEKEVYIIKEKYKNGNATIDTFGAIQVSELKLRGCTKVELQKDCTITCNELII